MGVIEVVVLAHPKSTLKAVKDLVIKDLLYSLKHRIEILSDDFETNDNPFIHQLKTIKLQLPRRITFPLNTFTLTGYTNQDPDQYKSLVSSISTMQLPAIIIKETLPLFPQTIHVIESTQSTLKPSLKLFWMAWAICLLLIIYLIKSLSS